MPINSSKQELGLLATQDKLLMCRREENGDRHLLTHINDNSFIQQALFLCSHDKVVRVVLVVHNVLQVDACDKESRKIIGVVSLKASQISSLPPVSSLRSRKNF